VDLYFMIQCAGNVETGHLSTFLGHMIMRGRSPAALSRHSILHWAASWA